MIYVFGLNGTLINRWRPMPNEEKDLLRPYLMSHFCVLVTSQSQETVDYLLGDLTLSFSKIYTCEGNMGRPHLRSEVLETALDGYRKQSDYVYGPDTYFDFRPGVISFSVGGINPNFRQFREYRHFDKLVKERHSIIKRARHRFPGYSFTLGSNNDIVVTQKGQARGQILNDFPKGEKFLLFAGNVRGYGVNHQLHKECYIWYESRSFRETELMLRSIS